MQKYTFEVHPYNTEVQGYQGCIIVRAYSKAQVWKRYPHAYVSFVPDIMVTKRENYDEDLTTEAQ